jgi:hypothetical protein
MLRMCCTTLSILRCQRLHIKAKPRQPQVRRRMRMTTPNSLVPTGSAVRHLLVYKQRICLSIYLSLSVCSLIHHLPQSTDAPFNRFVHGRHHDMTTRQWMMKNLIFYCLKVEMAQQPLNG